MTSQTIFFFRLVTNNFSSSAAEAIRIENCGFLRFSDSPNLWRSRFCSVNQTGPDFWPLRAQFGFLRSFCSVFWKSGFFWRKRVL